MVYPHTMLDDLPRLVPLSQTARRLRVPSRWLRAEAQAGRVPHLDAGGRLLFDPAAVAAALIPRAQGPVGSQGGRHE